MRRLFCILFLIFLIPNLASAKTMKDDDKSKALDCVGIYMANYFLPSGEKFEYSMKENSLRKLGAARVLHLRHFQRVQALRRRAVCEPRQARHEQAREVLQLTRKRSDSRR